MRRNWWLLALLLVAALQFAVSAWRDGGVLARQEPADEAPEAVALADDDPDWVALQDWVSELRGLPRLRPVPRVLLSPRAFRERQAAIYRDYLSAEELERTRQLMVGLGMIGPDDDLATTVLGLYGALPIGLYDPADATLYVRSVDPSGPLERYILAHEYVHALQDQHHGLRGLYPPPANADRDAAIGALIEGDALLVQEMYRRTTQPPTEEERVALAVAWEESLAQVYVEIGQLIAWETLPLPVVEQIYFPYLDGPRWIHAVLGDAPLTTYGAYGPAVDALFRRPPQSTTQILHPEKYLANVQPLRVELPELASALDDEWREVRRQVIGELEHRRLLGRHLPEEEADAAAEGWAGNRVVVLARGSEALATVGETRWESAAEAAEWVDAYRRWAVARGDTSLLWAENGRLIWQLPDGVQLLQREGARTLSVHAPTVAQAEALADRAFPSPLGGLRALLGGLLPRGW